MIRQLFPLAVTFLFVGAAIVCFVYADWGKGWFYLLSAGINLNVMFLK